MDAEDVGNVQENLVLRIVNSRGGDITVNVGDRDEFACVAVTSGPICVAICGLRTFRGTLVTDTYTRMISARRQSHDICAHTLGTVRTKTHFQEGLGVVVR